MAVDERGERSQILLFHLLKLLGLRESLLNQQGIGHSLVRLIPFA
jgi:hypothetical protein